MVPGFSFRSFPAKTPVPIKSWKVKRLSVSLPSRRVFEIKLGLLYYPADEDIILNIADSRSEEFFLF
jgi:hypothetical protein